MFINKRLFDLFFSTIVILFVLLWLIPAVAIIIYLQSGELFFFQQKRIGQFGKPFNIYKFRSMKGVSPKNDPLLSEDEQSRITKFGSFLRKYRIDEFPQFINVWKGEMSIVGPRPERQFFLDQIIKELPSYSKMQNLKPGITSIGQIKYGYADTLAQMLERARYDLIYLKKRSFWLDFKLILKTVFVVLKGKGK
jgi:lipopolysaccharide/colanic/teichoic acid biosynthesis glycosyltransferase